jgi:hypothetical protein
VREPAAAVVMRAAHQTQMAAPLIAQSLRRIAYCK